MSTGDRTTPEWARWQHHFAEVIRSGDRGELTAATEGAVAAVGQGADDATAKQAGRAALRRYREGRGWSGPAAADRPAPGRGPQAADFGDLLVATAATSALPATWPAELAGRLFSPPARWGWRVADDPAPGPADADATAEAGAEPPRQGTRPLVRPRSAALTRLVARLALRSSGVAGKPRPAQALAHGQDAESGHPAPPTRDEHRRTGGPQRLPVGPTSAVGPGRPASSARDERWRAGGPRWSPVGPAPDASRIDVIGGDARRRGWASLLVTFGTSVLAGGQRLTVFDLTGQDVGGGLLGVARARGLGARRVDLPGDSLDVSLLEGLTGPEIAESLAGALTDQRRERAFAEELLALVIAGLGGWPTFDRLARGIDVLRRVVPADPLPAGEVRALADRAGELGQDEWTAGQMHRVGSRLRALDALLRVEGAPAAAVGHQPLWAAEQVSLVTTASGAGERKVLLDRLLVELTQRALRRRGHLDGTLVVAGADHLGAASLDALSQRARTSGVRLVLMVDHPRGELDEALGTGGAVCIMQMADHGDATAAADLVGRGHEPAVEPRQVVDLPETAFILVEGSGPGRRVELADSDPALCLRLDPAPLDLR